MKELGKLETQLDDLDGWGQLLVKDCVEPDGEVIQQKMASIRSVIRSFHKKKQLL